MVLIIILYALLASSFTMGKVLLYYTTPMFLTGCRMFTAGTLLLSYQYFNNHKQFIFKKKHKVINLIRFKTAVEVINKKKFVIISIDFHIKVLYLMSQYIL